MDIVIVCLVGNVVNQQQTSEDKFAFESSLDIFVSFNQIFKNRII